ncbi:MAG: DUF349 domain-containing protein, partial [Bacteroidota bacterium]
MENAEKVQVPSKENEEKALGEVQQGAELTSNQTEEERSADTIPEDTQSEGQPPVEETEVADQQEAVVEAPEVQADVPEIVQEEPAIVASTEDDGTVDDELPQETATSPVQASEEAQAVGEGDVSEIVENEALPEVHEEEVLDFHDATKKELVTKLRELNREDNIHRIDQVLKAIKPRFDELYESEKAEAFKKFEEAGNDPDSFDYHGGEIDKEFHVLYHALKSKRNKFYKDLEQQKELNLKKKEELLEKLRHVVDSEESATSINAAKEIQTEWKKVGPVPGAHNKTLWANYNALLDRFYDQRSIYFELKDLDRKKNLKIKEELCQKAEGLAELDDLKAAIVQLNELHDEYKHSGPVPRDDQENIWQRFKAASDAVYSRRKVYFDQLKVELEENQQKKQELAVEAEGFVNFSSEKITEWNAKTKEIQELQKRWEAIGGLPRDKAKATNKQFWGSFKVFFNHKNQFFKQLESTREENLKLKEELVQQADALKESDDWNSATQKFKDLQAQWKEIGPVPEKVRNEIYKRFKGACDHFFDKRRAQNSEQDREYQENLTLKLQICDQIEAIADQDEINLDDVYDLIDNYADLGFVPRNAIKKVQNRFEEATHAILNLEDLEEGDRSDLKNHIYRSRSRRNFGGGGDRKVQRQEHTIRRKISEL